MTELSFKGKEFVYNHHLSVPFRPLEPHSEKGVGPTDLDGNLVVQGDNLHALKALLPRYSGKVDCVFIDPPYNTGNEAWHYSDNVNSPIIRKWLSENPIGGDDGLRHDKWCAMMWPRLRLLHELLSETGSIWITLDDNEISRATAMCDEIFGENSHIATNVWHKADSPKNTAKYFSTDHDYILVYAKNKDVWRPNLVPRTEQMLDRYKNPDDDPRGPWMTGDLDARNYYSKGNYPIQIPDGELIPGPPNGRYWTISEEKFWEFDRDNRIYWGADGRSQPNIKKFLSEVRDGVVPQTLWPWQQVGSTRNSKSEINKIFPEGFKTEEDESDAKPFVTPKPSRLIERVVEIATQRSSIVLDSFAGSGTTAEAVLRTNSRDHGERKFILVEMENYAEELTAERVRRVISGYEFKGKLKEELFRRKISMTQLKKSNELLERANEIVNDREGSFDKVTVTVKDGDLVVVGENHVEDSTGGFGGGFTYCTLGEPLDLDRLLTGDYLPPWSRLGEVLFHMATACPFDEKVADEQQSYLGRDGDRRFWLIYKDDLDFLKSADAALTLSRAEAFAATTEDDPDARHVVFAPTRFVSEKLLKERGVPVEFAPLPFALYRVTRN